MNEPNELAAHEPTIIAQATSPAHLMTRPPCPSTSRFVGGRGCNRILSPPQLAGDTHFGHTPLPSSLLKPFQRLFPQGCRPLRSTTGEAARLIPPYYLSSARFNGLRPRSVRRAALRTYPAHIPSQIVPAAAVA